MFDPSVRTCVLWSEVTPVQWMWTTTTVVAAPASTFTEASPDRWLVQRSLACHWRTVLRLELALPEAVVAAVAVPRSACGHQAANQQRQKA